MEFAADDDDDHDEEQEEETSAAAAHEIGLPPAVPPPVPPPPSLAAAAIAEATYDLTSRAARMAASGGGGRKPISCRYRECLKNHAVSIGGHAVDGCGEFMPAGEEGTLDALKCAACNCHRNFHRKDTGEDQGHPLHHPHHYSPYYHRSPAGYLPMAPHNRVPLALPSTSGGGGGQSREDQEDISNPSSGGGGGGGGGSGSSGRKRFRTKFSQEQKDRMLAFAERLGWRIQKQDEAVVQQFCTEAGVKRQVLKVWMHNNKHTLGGKKP